MPTHLPAFFNPASHQTKKICPLLTTSGDFQIIKSAFLLSQINPSGPATPLQPAIWLHFRQSTINIDLNQRSVFLPFDSHLATNNARHKTLFFAANGAIILSGNK
jgi:hypothetical protein